MIASETFWELLKSPGHWLFEAFTDVVFGFILGGIVWPKIQAHIHRDIKNVDKHLHPGEKHPYDPEAHD